MVGADRRALLARSPLFLPLVLFVASAAFTLWRNTEVGVLVDIAYPLNTATRIAAGDVPYRDFPLAHAPLHFLVQAALIKLFGPQFLVQIVYAAVFGGLATVLTYAIARRLLDGAVRSPRTIAAILAVPLVPLGIYAIYPHPFYDPDACLAVLGAILGTLVARERAAPWRWILAGALLTIPLLIKQNIGGAFLALAIAALAAEAMARPAARSGLRWCVVGLVATLGIEVAALQIVVGLDHVIRWTWSFAMAGRGVSLGRIDAFGDPRVLWPVILLLGPALAARVLVPRARAAVFVAALCVPAVAAMISPNVVLAVPELFPPVLIAASALALVRVARDGWTFETLLPIVLLATTVGTIQSQGLPGSTFGIFPLLVLAVASFVRELARSIARPVGIAPMTGAVLALLLTVSGSVYTLSNERLTFIDVNAPGPVARSTFPSLFGLSARGPYLPDLDEILRWTEQHVPREDAIVFLPGEDPAFYALGRRPRLPSVYFYDIAGPLPPEEVARSADEVGLRWVFVKDRLQITDPPPLHETLVALLTEGAQLVANVGAYRVYRRE